MKRGLFLPLTILLPMQVFAANTPLVIHDLATVARQALLRDPRTTQVTARLRQSSAELAIANAGYRPEIALTASMGRSHYRADHFPDPYRTPNAIEMHFNQPLYDFGRTTSNVSAAAAQLQASHADITATVQAVIRDAIIAALQVDLAHKRLNTEDRNEQVLAKRVDYARSKFHLGDFTYTDVAQARARYADARARKRAAQAALSRAQAQLSRLTGSAMDVTLPRLPNIVIPSSLDQALQLIHSNPALDASKYRLMASREDVAYARTELYPRVNLIGAFGRDDDTRFSNEPTTYWYTELRLSVPLYNRGSDRAGIRQAQAAVDQFQAQQTSLTRMLTQQVRNAWADLTAAKDEITAAREQEVAATQALHGVEAELEAGTRTIIDLLDAQQAVLNARLAVLNVGFRAVINRLQLSAATGQLDLTTLIQ